MLNNLKIGVKLQLSVAIILIISSIVTVVWLEKKFKSQMDENIYSHAHEVAIMSQNTLNMFMLSGMISDTNNRKLFFEKTNKSEEILDFRVIRAQSVSDTYGPGLAEEQPKDAIDKQVLETGKEVIIKETVNGKETIRLVYPYKASKDFRGTDCTSCHFVKEDSILGAASITLDISKPMEEIASNIQLLWIMAGVLVIIMVTLVYFVSNRFISRPLAEFEHGLSNFFDFINRKTQNIQPINDTTNDEIGNMAKVINQNIKTTQNTILEDNRLIDEAKFVIGKVKNGKYSEQINGSTSNPTLNSFKNDVNEMIIATREHFVDMNHILQEYANMDYRRELKIEGIENGGVFETLLNDINKVRDTITQMLIDNKSTGLTLQNSSDQLLNNVNQLNTNSTQAAQALEETANALDEVTNNVSTTTKNIIEMSNHASNVTNSVKSGQELANQTSLSMDGINQEVTAINDAITVIDQIAFQTNILSLNAAVEAATAGEAGKGFAVVAGEVRNLASRSAEAAKEIKDLVEKATAKANDGKMISDKMIEGYKELNNTISSTIDLIGSVETASKKQQEGIVQINDAINSLDKQTKKNAQIASQTNEIAQQTDNIATEAVKSVLEKKFVGMDDIKIKSIPKKTIQQTPLTLLKPTKIEQKIQKEIKVEKKPTQIETIKSQTDDDEWASF